MIESIKEKLSKYIEFDISEIFVTDMIRVFGGSIRDSISNRIINDIDILVGPKSYDLLSDILISNGYSYCDSITYKSLSNMYNDIHIISEPHTYMNKSGKIVQLIRPRIKESDNYKEQFIDLIKNVDISCCGLSTDGNYLYENYKDAIAHCLSNVFVVNDRAKMYNSKRIYDRIFKMEKRGWEMIVLDNNIKLSRRVNINNININNSLYIIE